MKKRRIVIQVGLFVLGAAMVGVGAFRGELTEIMRKATIVCLECIGIG